MNDIGFTPEPKENDNTKKEKTEKKGLDEILGKLLKKAELKSETERIMELDKRLEDLAVYAASHGLMTKPDPQDILRLFGHFKMRIKKGCFDIEWLEKDIVRRFGPLPVEPTEEEKQFIKGFNLPSYEGPRYYKNKPSVN